MAVIVEPSRKSGIQFARELHQKIEEILGMQVQVILFGSHARGEATEDSDVDVLVMVENLDRFTLDSVLDVAWQVGFDANRVISVIPVTQKELEVLSVSPFFQTVQKEGIYA